MKWILLLPLWCILQEQPFTVVDCGGGAYLKRAPNSLLKKGDHVLYADSFRFSESRGYIRLAGPGGTFIVTTQGDPRKNTARSPELWLMIRNECIPTFTKMVMRGKSGALSTPEDVALYFSRFNADSLPMLVLDTVKVEISPQLLPAGKQKFFFLSWNYQGKQVNSPVPVISEKGKRYLRFDRSLLLFRNKETGMTSMQQATINLYDTLSKEATELTTVNIYFTGFREIRNELSLVARNVRAPSGPGDVYSRKETYKYLLSYFGFIDEEIFNTKYYPQLDLKSEQ